MNNEYAMAHRAGNANLVDPSGFCAGCLPRFKDRMMQEGRCRHPDVTFELEDGKLVGRRPLDKPQEV